MSIATLFPTVGELPADFSELQPVEQREYLLNGELLSWQGDLSSVFSPVCVRNGEQPEPVLLGQTPLLDAQAALQALDAAVSAYDLGRGPWPTMPVLERIQHVETFLELMQQKRDDVIRLLMWEIGKPYKDAAKEFDRTSDYIRDTIDALKQQDRDASHFVIEQGTLGKIRRVPVGVALCMGPFNYPLNETFTTLIPALIMGNTVIFKPAKYGVLLIRPLLQAFRDSFPPGVINVIYGRGRETVGVLMESGKVDLFAFIGTNKGASDLKKMHPKPHRLRAVLGLDAKNPAIVMADADMKRTVSECVAGALSFNGQRCTALKILFVHRSRVDEFVQQFVSAVEALPIGMPWQEGVAITPLPEPGKTDFLQQLVDDACQQGARICNQSGGEHCATLFRPAVLYPVTAAMRVYDEEQFGPVIPIVPFDDIQQAIDYVIHSNFGQQLSLFGQNPQQLGELVDRFSNQVGRININSQCQRGPDSFPFNGRKDSAEGTLSVIDALRQFSTPTVVAAKYQPQDIELVKDMIKQRSSHFLSTDFLF
ncbi:NADP-dependent glyceraldehyde-3-phosphate dehydrogenase [Alkalimonas collagenimarina]|uniref:NADP-dependent glyceraldehyde-3-phosphate dehydrogenase n=1 Tax=Alkalimonas collagenimarina TaxID=400390 RepID=A0ABT9H0H9_9GAMM|nr:NADP-dependent glyceraldehyde-3-phosphate dehydrogenase [Alkalimonas collagenimarina]MDP4536801.1 NADP-dependent glyceraldehyde-3-phosphate dehydrogenase [Alkalimonas collagenimarina]